MKDLKKSIKTILRESLNNSKTLNCTLIKLTDEIIAEVNKFQTVEKLLRAGGISISALDRAAYGFSTEDVKTLNPSQLKIKWKEDLQNVKHEIEVLNSKSGGRSLSETMKIWANSVDLTTPIDVSYEKNSFYIEDGHHRYFAAKILKKDLNVNLEIKMNPIITLAPLLSYDDFHRCLFNQVKNIPDNKLKESLNENVNNIVYKKSIDGDRTEIIAYKNNIKIGSLEMEILFDAYQYEFEDVFDEDTFNELYPGSEIIKIEYITVKDDYKNFGIGSELMKRGMALMKKNGYNQFYLNASPMGFEGLVTMDLVNFYKKFGFKELLNQGHNVLMGVSF